MLLPVKTKKGIELRFTEVADTAADSDEVEKEEAEQPQEGNG